LCGRRCQPIFPSARVLRRKTGRGAARRGRFVGPQLRVQVQRQLEVLARRVAHHEARRERRRAADVGTHGGHGAAHATHAAARRSRTTPYAARPQRFRSINFVCVLKRVRARKNAPCAVQETAPLNARLALEAYILIFCYL
jgi:hypothetical protein